MVYFVLLVARVSGGVESNGVEVVTRPLNCRLYRYKKVTYQLDPQVTFNLFISVVRDQCCGRQTLAAVTLVFLFLWLLFRVRQCLFPGITAQQPSFQSCQRMLIGV